LTAGRYADAPPSRSDDWSALAIPAAPTVPAMASTDGLGSTDDGGPRRQPELSEVSEYSLDQAPSATDLAMLDDDDDPLPLPAALDPAMQRAARLAALDPNDGIAL
jgi:type IV secretion system protein VirD4